MFYGQNISIYKFRGWQGDKHGIPYIFCSLFKNGKYKSMTYTKIKFYILIFFSRMHNKKIKKRGTGVAELK